MPLTQDARDRLARLGYAIPTELQFWERLQQSEGESFFLYFMEREEAAANECRRWLPQLRAFAADCRQATPAPDPATFTPTERAQHDILLTKMQAFLAPEDRRCVFDRRPNRAAVLYTTAPGLPAAERVFAGTDAVLLLDDEWWRWYGGEYPGVGDEFWWYAQAWWTVKDGPGDWGGDNISAQYPIPAGGSYWVVTSGVAWGSLAGGANHELWAWDGSRAEKLGLAAVDSY